ncbi:MAG: malectin domain-containing carbohydrate-binding protein [Tepidisphaerales bacterium]
MRNHWAKIASVIAIALAFKSALAEPMVVIPKNASASERLAGQEVRRYVYVRTGRLLPIRDGAPGAGSIVVAGKGAAMLPRGIADAAQNLGPEQFVLKTTNTGDGPVAWIVGADASGTLYGAYRFAEKLGVRFYLHGDVVPDEQVPFAIPNLDETGKPLFSIRGIQPFHDFPEGPDWWNRDDYLAYISQLPKMRMNFLGLHCYPEGGVGPEPLVWIGTKDDLDATGQPRFSYSTAWFNTSINRWGYAPMKTSEYCAGSAALFAVDPFGPDVMRRMLPRPNGVEQSNIVFNDTAAMLRDVFADARSLGVKTCIGTETPLTIPRELKAHLKQQGKNPDDPAIARELYEGMFRRIAQVYPLDYYWLWTPEDWTWGGNKPQQFAATACDIQAALDALAVLGKPFTLATCGWVLGPQHDRAALDKLLPKDSPMSCINREVGHADVETAFANVSDRPKWAIPWMENDPNLIAPQPWVGRMRFDAADARRLGCTGLLGIHWRTKAMAMNVSALASAGWDQSWAPAEFAAKVSTLAKVEALGAIGGNVAKFNAPVADATPEEQAIYQVVRYDVDGYLLAVPNGTYRVTLKLNEPNYDAAGKRVFGASVQGKELFKDLDIFARVGKNKAIDFTAKDVRVTDGRLKIDFIRQVEFPCIAGIVITGTTDPSNQIPGQPFTRKINCGGEKHGDFEADNVGTPKQSINRNRAMPVEDFYLDFAKASFGPESAAEIGAVFASIDGTKLPEPSTWLDGPGGIKPNNKPWAEEKKAYEFVDKLTALRDKVRGPGNLQRFDYWLNTYQYMAVMAELGCMRGQLDKSAATLAAEKDPAQRKTIAQAALTIRTQMARQWEKMVTLQLATIDTPGDLGTLTNLEQHNRKQNQFLSKHDKVLTDALGTPLPPDTEPGLKFTGSPRLVVPTFRTQVTKGQPLQITVFALDAQPFKSVAVVHTGWSQNAVLTVPCKHVGGALWTVLIPTDSGDFEYQVVGETVGGQTLVWPATAPKIQQTVICTP